VAAGLNHAQPGDPDRLAQVLIAAAGGRIMANVGRTTTILVVAGARPFSSGVRTTASFLRAEAIAADSGTISILTTEELRDRIAVAAPTT